MITSEKQNFFLFNKRLKSLLSVRVLLVAMMCFMLSACTSQVVFTADFWNPTLQDCWPCAMYGTVFETLVEVLTYGIPVCASFCTTLLLVFLPLYIVVRLGRVALDPEMTYQKTMKELGYALLKAIAVSIVLYNNAAFYELFMGYFLQPVGSLFLGIANILLDGGPVTSTSLELRAFDAALPSDTIWNGVTDVAIPPTLFGNLPYQLQAIVFRIYCALRSGVGIGVFMLNSATRWDILAFIASLFIIFYSLELSLVVPYTFVEALLKLGIACVILPILLICWIFEGSSKLIPQLKAVVPLALTAFWDIVFTCAFVLVMATTLQIYADTALDQVWSRGTTGTDVSIVMRARFLHVNVLILIILMLAFTKLAEKVPEISRLYGGGSASSAWFMRDKIKKSAQGLAKTAAGLVTANLALMWSGMKQTVQGVIKK